MEDKSPSIHLCIMVGHLSQRANVADWGGLFVVNRGFIEMEC